jgi:hypothetical protein
MVLTLLAIAKVAAPWLAKLPDIVGNALKNQGTMRVRREEARLSVQVEERRAVLTQSLIREQHERNVVLQRLQVQSNHYPLGNPGRFRESRYSPRPVVLVSPFPGGLIPQWGHGGPGVDELTYDRLRDAAEISRYAELLTGAFIHDGDRQRAIQGVSDAQEIAAVEFVSRPAILIYFERHADGLTAFAYLARMFATTNGDYGFPLRIAKFTTTGDPTRRPAATPQDTDLPTWQLIDLSGFREAREEVIAAVISWFTLSTLDMYWLLQGVPRTGLLASAFADFGGSPTQAGGQAGGQQLLAAQAAAPPPITLAEPTDTDSPFLERLETEMVSLACAGFTFGEVLEFAEDQIALVVSKEGLDIAFALSVDYPAKPPLVLTFGAQGGERFDIDESGWTPDRRLLEIAETLI